MCLSVRSLHWVLHRILASPTLSPLIFISPVFLIVIRYIRVLLSPTAFLPASLFISSRDRSSAAHVPLSFFHLSYPFSARYIPANLPSLLPFMHLRASTFTPAHFCQNALFLLHSVSLRVSAFRSDLQCLLTFPSSFSSHGPAVFSSTSTSPFVCSGCFSPLRFSVFPFD